MWRKAQFGSLVTMQQAEAQALFPRSMTLGDPSMAKCCVDLATRAGGMRIPKEGQLSSCKPSQDPFLSKYPNQDTSGTFPFLHGC